MRKQQNIGSVVRFHAGNITGMVRNADGVHRPALMKSPGLGKHSSATRERLTYRTDCPDTWPGGSVLETELAETPESFPATARTAGDPPAAIWASLVLTRAMSS